MTLSIAFNIAVIWAALALFTSLFLPRYLDVCQLRALEKSDAKLLDQVDQATDFVRTKAAVVFVALLLCWPVLLPHMLYIIRRFGR